MALSVKGPLLTGAPESPNQVLPELKMEETAPLRDSQFGEEEGQSEVVFIENRFSFSVSDHLTRIPGVQVNQLNLGAPPRFLLQGMNPEQNRIFLEGLPLGEPYSQTAHAALIPTLSIESVEVFPGLVPVHFLSSGLGGAIDIQLETGSQKKNSFLTQLGNLGFLRASGHSHFSDGHQVSIEWTQSRENFSFLDNNGTPLNSSDDSVRERTHNGFQRALFFPSLSWHPGALSRIHLFSLNSFQRTEVPGPTHSPDFSDLNELMSFTGLKGRFQTDLDSILEGAVYFRAQQDQLSGLRVEQTSQQLGYGARLNGAWKTEALETGLGMGFDSSQYNGQGRSLSFPVSVHGVGRLSEKWELKPAVLGQMEVSLESPERVSAFRLSPRLGWQFQLSNHWRLRGLIGQFFRTPSLAETLGNQTSLEANPNLTVEKALKSELGMDWFFSGKNNQFRFSSTLFGAQAHNLIVYAPQTKSTQRAENIGRARWLGQEFLAEMQNSIGLTLRPSASVLFTTNDSDWAAEKGKQLPNRFPFSSRVEVGFQKPRGEGGYRLSYFSSSFLDRANTQKMEGYFVHDIYGGLNTRALGRFELTFANLLNVQNVGTVLDGNPSSASISGFFGYPTSGRRISALWKYDW